MNAISPPSSASQTMPSMDDVGRPPQIVCRNVCKQFGRQQVLRGVDLTIPSGAVVGLVGTNGSGKSTLIKCLLGLLKPTSGQMTVFGHDPWFLSGPDKANLGYVPQVVQLYPWMRVQQIVEYTGAFYERWDQAWAEMLLDRLELPRDQRVGPLSTGQQQKLALVLALGHRPELLVFDEPVASLDPIARRQLLRTLMELAANNQHTILFSTHITSDLERIASHVALLRNGRIVLFDELDAIKDRVKRLRLASTHPLPSNLTIRGSLRTQVDGNQALVTVTDLSESLLSEVRATYHAEVTVEDLNLEDIFVELHQE